MTVEKLREPCERVSLGLSLLSKMSASSDKDMITKCLTPGPG